MAKMKKVDWISDKGWGCCHAYFAGSIATIRAYRRGKLFVIRVKRAGRPDIVLRCESLACAKRAGSKWLRGKTANG